MGFWEGNATDWGTAIGTVGLALITSVSVIREGRERRELKDERDVARSRAEQLEQQETDRVRTEAETAADGRRRIYAEAVSCYVDTVPEDQLPKSPMGQKATFRVVPPDGAIVRNLSDAAIRDVEVVWQDGRTEVADDNVAGIAPDGHLTVVPPLSVRAVMRPRDLARSDWASGDLALLIKFTDINGVRWALRHDGRLYSVTETGSLGEVAPRAR